MTNADKIPHYFIKDRYINRFQKRNGNGQTDCSICHKGNWDCFLYTDITTNKPICFECIKDMGGVDVRYD